MVKHLHYTTTNRKKRMPTAPATEQRAKRHAELSIWNLFAKLEVRTLSTFFVSPEDYSMNESVCQVLFTDFFCYFSFSNGGKCGMMSAERRNSCETNPMCSAGPLSASGADGLPDGKNAGGNVPAYGNAKSHGAF